MLVDVDILTLLEPEPPARPVRRKRTQEAPVKDDGIARAEAKARTKAGNTLSADLETIARLATAAARLADEADPNGDQEAAIQAFRRVVELADQLDPLKVTATTFARAHGVTWANIGSHLGMERSNAHSWYERRTVQ